MTKIRPRQKPAMLNPKTIFSALLVAAGGVLLVADLALSDPKPWADNVCNTSFPVEKDIIIQVPRHYEIKVPSMCGILPCQKTRKEIKIDEIHRSSVQYVIKHTCCPGYAETPDRRCAPICLQPCKNGGKCVAPNTCRCQPEPSLSSPGFVGPTCGRFVCSDDSKWGSKCERNCECSGNTYCAADSGKCVCFPGWRGSNCTEECDPDSQSLDCGGDNRLPSIIEPESNLVYDDSVMSRQKAEPLVLDDTVRITSNNDWGSVSSIYMIGLLSLTCIILLVALLLVKRRYNKMRNELYYSAATTSDGTNYSVSGDSSYSSYYTNGRSAASGADTNLVKNLSFAAATRNIVLGENSKPHGACDEIRKKTVIDPLVESHLIRSQKPADHNIYSDIALHMGADKDRQTEAYEHVYQVPKSAANLSQAGRSNDRSTTTVDTYDDSTSNIYEEIKPRTRES